MKLTAPISLNNENSGSDSCGDIQNRRYKRKIEDGKTLERLVKNRESARESRKRKKAQMESVERRLRELEDENKRLLLELKKGKEQIVLEENEKWNITMKLSNVFYI